MTEAETLTLQLLKQIDHKLETLLQRLRDARDQGTAVAKSNSRAERAREIAALTPQSIKQTDAVELLHEDRLR
jgi:hypothetical protein